MNPGGCSLNGRESRQRLTAPIRGDDTVVVPQVTNWFQNGFHRFLGTYLRRHFHALGVNRSTMPSLADPSVLIFGNHPTWWDPLIGHFLNLHLFAPRQFYAPIDHDALEHYRVFAKLGFFGVKQSRAGIADFLRLSNAILDSHDSALWITPEGRFADARDHEAELMPGLSHLCSRRRTGVALAMAMEYVFWDERLPVCLIQFSEPLSLAEHATLDKSDWNELLTRTLRDTQQSLSKRAIARSSEPFDDLLRGNRGAGGVYDVFRRAKSWATGKRFRANHGSQFE